jgi:regulator of replication initiation timing
MQPEDTVFLEDAVDTKVEAPIETPAVETPEVVIEAPKQSEHELKAIEKGWNPDKEAYEAANPGKKWRPAEDYIERGEIFDTIHNLKRKVTESEKRFETLEQHYQKVKEHTKAEVEKNLRNQLKEASEIGDFDAVNRITDEIVNVKTKSDEGTTTHTPQPNTQLPEEVVHEIREFTQRNAHWFTYDPLDADKYALSSDALAYDNELGSTNPNLPLRQRFDLVEKFIKAKYPHKFVNPKQSAPAAVESGVPASKPSNKEVKISDLPAHHQRVIKTLKPESQKQYIADLKAIGEI